jgi:hypothetical protein
MVEENCLVQEHSSRLHLLEKGLQVYGKLQDMFNRQTMALVLDCILENDLRTANEILGQLEWFWGGGWRLELCWRWSF